jgi:serpin B
MTRPTFLFRVALTCAFAGTLGATESPAALGLDQFSAALYRELAIGDRDNMVFSPLSISSALSMALAGARGRTAAEMAKALRQPDADVRYYSDLAALLQQVAKSGNADGNQFLNANRLWLQKDFKILPDFRNTLQMAYGAPAIQADFAGDTERARVEINSWTERETHGKIRDLFGRGTLNERSRLVLSSVTWFLGKWEHAFHRSETRPEPFRLPSGTNEQADFMHQTGRFGYAETGAANCSKCGMPAAGLPSISSCPDKAPL